MTLSDEAAVDLLEEMLRISSLTGHEDALAEFLLEYMGQAGFRAGRDEAGNVIGCRGVPDAPRSLVILGHMDTVPGEVPVERRNGKLYGRGAVDAKGPLAAALAAVTRATIPDSLAVTVIGAVQEEGPSSGARFLATQPGPDYLIVAEPSGWDAIVMGYKGSQRFTVSWWQPWSHSAGPESTAPERLIDFWNRLVVWCGEKGSADGGVFDQLTPALLQMTSTSDGLADTAALSIGLRLPPGVAPTWVAEEVRTLLPGAEFNFSAGEPAVRGEKGNPLVSSFLRSVRAEGGRPRFKVKTGTSDMNVVGPAWLCPMVAYGPGDSRLDHTPEEHIEIDEYLRAIRVLTQVVEGI